LLGNATSASQPASTSLFSNTTTTTQPASMSLFSTTQPVSTGLFGNASTAGQAGSTNLFGNTNAATNQPRGNIFGNLGTNAAQNSQPSNNLFGNTQAQQQQAQPLQPALDPTLGDTRRIWSEEDAMPRARTVVEQLQLVQRKWFPRNPQTVFSTYLYNQVDPQTAPFYRPGPADQEEAWEAALQKAPTPGSIPVQLRGFLQLGERVVMQRNHLAVLSGRLHEINNGLTALLRKHELEISSRATAARRRHIALSQRVLALATKTMIARNRGYALDGAEEDLRKRLVGLERTVMDPSLAGREEEIWARMVNVRERGRILEMEMARAGMGNDNDRQNRQEIDEETMKRAKKVSIALYHHREVLDLTHLLDPRGLRFATGPSHQGDRTDQKGLGRVGGLKTGRDWARDEVDRLLIAGVQGRRLCQNKQYGARGNPK